MRPGSSRGRNRASTAAALGALSSRRTPPGVSSARRRRVDAEMLAEVGPRPAEQPRFYACGPTPFVEAVAEALVRLGHETRTIKTQRFGPTGGRDGCAD